MTRHRYQIRFTKSGLLRWTSHRDLARIWERLVRRAGLQIAMSEGFSPKAKISFPTALALGIESYDEVVELELTVATEPLELLQKLNADPLEGMRISEVCKVPDGVKKAQFLAGHYVLQPSDEEPLDEQTLNARIDQLRADGTITFRRKHKDVEANVHEQIARLEFLNGRLHMTLRASRTASLRPDDVLKALGLEHLLESGARLVRKSSELDRQIDSDHCVTADFESASC